MYCKQMYPVCLRYCKDSASASAALQAGFLKVFSNINKLQDNDKLGGWIRRIIVHASIDQLKKDKQFRFEELEDYRMSVPQTTDVEYSQEGILRYLELLPPGYKLILTLNVIDDLPHKEIAKIVGITEGSSRSQLFKAKRMTSIKY